MWNLKFITIKDIQNYRKCHDILVDRVTTTKIADQIRRVYGVWICKPPEWGTSCSTGKRLKSEMEKIVLCRVHSECLTGDVFSDHSVVTADSSLHGDGPD